VVRIGPARSRKGSIMSGPIYMRFSNFSSYELRRQSNMYGAVQEGGISSLSKTPTDTLTAYGGATDMEMDSTFLSNLGTGDYWMSCGWDIASGSSGPWGVKISVPVQVLHIGDRPYYQIKSMDFKDWTKPVKNPYDGYEFKTQTPLKIKITPTSGHTSLSLDVVIQQ
jgi:hypothetical protein